MFALVNMDVAIPIFDGFVAAHAVVPYEFLSRVPGVAVRFIAAEPGPKRTDTGMLALTADFQLDDLPDPEIVVIPGGGGINELIKNVSFLSWLRTAHDSSQWTAAVADGATVLAAAGISSDDVNTLGTPTVAASRRVLTCGKVITATPDKASVDVALAIATYLRDAVADRIAA